MNDFEKIEQGADATLQKHPEEREIPEARIGRGTFEAGATIATQYKVLELIGTGGMSHVYRCEDLAINRIIAVKTLHLGASDNAISRFQTEGKAIARLEHPNIVKLYGFQIASDGMPILTMEYVGGTTLAKLLASERSLAVQRVMRIAAQICNALSAAHKEGIIHRDLKPSNIMIVGAGSLDEKVKILDFGIAKIQGESGGIEATRTGEIFGTPQYMSPEQALGKRCDARTDQYSLGCVLFEMLSGRPPFTSESPLETMMAHVQEQAPSLSKVAKQSIPADLIKAIDQLLEKDPDRRFATMDDAAKAMFGEATSRKTSPSKTLILSLGLALVTVSAFTWLVFFDGLHLAGNRSGTDGTKGSERLLSNDDHRLARLVQQHPAITTLDLSTKDVTKAGVKIIGQLHSLKRLDLRECTQISPEDITDLAALPLTELDLEDTATNNASMTVVRKISCLKKLVLRNTAVTNDGIKCIAALPLSWLNLEGTNITNESLKLLSQMSTLEYLNLNLTDISKDGCRFLQSLDSLKELHVSATSINADDLQFVGRLGKLETLFIDHDPGISNGVAFLKDAPLHFLSLRGNHLTSKDVLALAQIRTLEKLDLRETNVSDRDLDTIARIPFLRGLYIPIGKTITPFRAEEFRRKTNNLCKVYADKSPDQASDSDTPEAIIQNGPNLLQNGSFETSSIPRSASGVDCYPGKPVIAHWTVAAGSVHLTGKQWAAGDGTYSFALNGSSPGAIEQTFKTKRGTRYVVTFMATTSPDSKDRQPQKFMATTIADSKDAQPQTFMLSAAGQHQDYSLFRQPDQSISSMNWTPHQWTFEATSANTTLRFASGVSGQKGACIDNVAVYRTR